MSQDRNLALCPIELPGHVERDSYCHRISSGTAGLVRFGGHSFLRSVCIVAQRKGLEPSKTFRSHPASNRAAYQLAHRCMWRRIEDLNLWSPCELCGFRNRRIRPTLPILHMAPREGLEPSPLSQIRNLALSPVELPGRIGVGRRTRTLKHLFDVTRVAGRPDTITASPHICLFDYREYSYLSPSTSSFSMHSQQPYSILHIKRTQPTSLTLPWLGPNSPMYFYLRLCW